VKAAVQDGREKSSGIRATVARMGELADAVLANQNIVGYVEALVDCKLIKFGREIPDRASVVSQREFKP
jgi:tetrahydromethanopterin S-methyltransferase subunit D